MKEETKRMAWMKTWCGCGIVGRVVESSWMKWLLLRAAAFACVLLLGVGMAQAAEAPAQLITRTFEVDPDFLTARKVPGLPVLTAQEILKAEGIDFPEGASAVFDPAKAQVVAVNTAANLLRIEACVYERSLGRAVPANAAKGVLPMTGDINVTMVLQIYSVSQKELLAAEALTKSEPRALQTRLGVLAAQGLATEGTLSAVTGRNGQKCLNKSGYGLLELTPVFDASQGRFVITGTYRNGSSTDPIQTMIDFGGTVVVFQGKPVRKAQKKGGKDGESPIYLYFLKVSAQPAGNAR